MNQRAMMLERALRWIGILILWAVAGCAPAPAPATPTSTPTSTPTLRVLPGIPGFTQSPVPTETPTPTVTLTETPLPTLELPTPAPQAPAKLFWTGEPTYPADSEPGLVWRLTYETDKWALIMDELTGLNTLAHRDQPTCTITLWQGAGLPADMYVDTDFRSFGLVYYEVATVFQGATPQFVTYTGGDRRVLTTFRVDFVENMGSCLADAELVLATLTSLAATSTPVP
jgi:hypothetical protein